jgi:flagellar FliL protein
MADENNNDQELKLNPPNNKKKLFVIMAIVIVLIVGAAAGTYFFFSDSDEILSETEINGQLKSSESIAPALYVALPRALRFNAPGANRDRFVEINVQLLVRSSDNAKVVKGHIPSIESTLLAVFSQAFADNLATSAGKATLKKKSLTEVQKVMTSIVGKPIVEQVLFTGFVMQ